MQNYWNLYLACKQQQLYGPVNYRDFWETVPCPDRLRDGQLSKCRPRGCSPKYSLPEGAWLRFFQCAVLFVPNFTGCQNFTVCATYILYFRKCLIRHTLALGTPLPVKNLPMHCPLAVKKSVPKNWVCCPHFSAPVIIKDVLRRKLWVLIMHRMKEM